MPRRTKAEYLEYLQEVKLRNLGSPSEIMLRRRNYYKSRFDEGIKEPSGKVKTSDSYARFMLDWLDDRITLSTKYEDPTFYFVLNRLSGMIEEGIKSNKVSFNSPIVSLDHLKETGKFPLLGSWFTNEINATSVKMQSSNDDYLIIFHTDLYNFCYLSSKLIAMVTSNIQTTKKHESLQEYIQNDCGAITENIEKRLQDNPIIIDRFVNLLSNFVNYGSVGLSQEYTPEEWYIDNTVLYTDTLELFILGHEYAHIICGHLESSSTTAALVGPNETITESVYDHTAEFEADVNGLGLMLGAIPTNKILLPYALCGPTIFFHFDDILERTKTLLQNGSEHVSETDYESHPRPLVRLDRLRQEIKNIPGSSIWGDSLLQPSYMIDKVTEALWGNIVGKLYTLHNKK